MHRKHRMRMNSAVRQFSDNRMFLVMFTLNCNN